MGKNNRKSVRDTTWSETDVCKSAFFVHINHITVLLIFINPTKLGARPGYEEQLHVNEEVKEE